jgi:hypothetical protein
MGGQGGGVYEQTDGSRYVYKDNQWQYEPAPVAGTPDPTNPYISRGNQDLPEYYGRRDPFREIGVPPQRDFFPIDSVNPDYDRLQNPLPERRDYPSRFQGPLMERIDYPKMAAPTNINSVYDLFQQILGRAPDDAGLAYWKQQFGDTIDPNEIAQFVEAAKTELDLLPLNPTPYPIIDLIGIPDMSAYPTTKANRFPIEDPIYKLYKDVLGR